MLCHDMICYDIICYDMIRYVMLSYVLLCKLGQQQQEPGRKHEKTKNASASGAYHDVTSWYRPGTKT